MKRLLLIFLLLASCARPYVKFGINDVDYQARQAILVAEGLIDVERKHLSAGQRPETAIDYFNAVVKAYNAARLAWFVYQEAVLLKRDPEHSGQALTDAITALVDELLTYRRAEPSFMKR